MSSPLLLLSSRVLREGQTEASQKCECLLVGLRGGGDRDVQAAHLLDVVVVDLRKDDLLGDPEREVAASVERAWRETAEVADPWQGDRDEAIEEFVHAHSAKRHARADRHPLA